MIEFLVFFSSVGFIAMVVKNYFLTVRVWNAEQRLDNLSAAIMSIHLDEALRELKSLDDLEDEINESNDI
jgi:hypothetical protein